MVDIENGQTRVLTNISVAMIILSSLAIILRFWSRLISPGTRVWIDDWFALASLPPALVNYALVPVWANLGFGGHMSQIPLRNVAQGIKVLLAAEILYDISVSLAKISALVFYIRIFGVRIMQSRPYRVAFWLTMGLAVTWCPAFILYAALQCSTPKKLWLPIIPGHCSPPVDTYVGSAITDVLIDIAILVLPLPQVVQLQMRLGKKILVGLLFVCGYSVIFISIGRLITIAILRQRLNEDFIYYLVPALDWGLAEPALSIISICLPSIFHLGKRFYEHGPYALISSKDFSRHPYYPSWASERLSQMRNSYASRSSIKWKLVDSISASRSRRTNVTRRSDDAEAFARLDSSDKGLPHKTSTFGLNAAGGFNALSGTSECGAAGASSHRDEGVDRTGGNARLVEDVNGFPMDSIYVRRDIELELVLLPQTLPHPEHSAAKLVWDSGVSSLQLHQKRTGGSTEALSIYRR